MVSIWYARGFDRSEPIEFRSILGGARKERMRKDVGKGLSGTSCNAHAAAFLGQVYIGLLSTPTKLYIMQLSRMIKM